MIKEKHNSVTEYNNALYDNVGRLISFDEPGYGTTSFSYDDGFIGKPDIITFSNSENGDVFNNVFSYDQLGRITDFEESINSDGSSESYSFQSSYDVFGRVKEIIYPTGFSILYRYKNGLLGKIIRGDNNNPVWELKEVNEKGQKEQVLFGNGVFTDYTYNQNMYLPENIHTYNGSADIQNFLYTWDNIGNLKKRRKLLNGLDVWESFDYDKLNRLTKVTLKGGEAVIEMDYNILGSITKKTSTNSDFNVASDYSYDINAVNPYKLLSINNEPVMYKHENQEIDYTIFDKIKSIREYSPESQPVLLRQLDMHYGIGHKRKIQLFKYRNIKEIKNFFLANNIINGIVLNGFVEVFK